MTAIVNEPMKGWVAALLLFWGSLAAAQDAPSFARAIVPVVGSANGVGGVRWKTRLELFNQSGQPATVMLLLPAAAPDEPFGIVLPPGESVRYFDVVAEVFNVESGLSPLIVVTEGRRSVTVRAQAYAVRGTEIFEAQPIAIDYGGLGGRTRILSGLAFSDHYRTNVGLVNLGSDTADFTIALQRVPGRNVAVNHVSVPPNGLWHMSIQSLFPLITKGGDFSIVVETASSETYVYSSVIDNDTHAGRFVYPR